MTENIENMVPHSDDAEQALLGCILLDPKVLMQIAVSADDFYIHKNRFVYKAMTALVRRRVGIDIVTLNEELANRNQLAEIGGMAYLSKLATFAPSSLGANDYALIVKEKAARRRLLTAANDLAKVAYNANEKLETVVPSILEKVSVSMRPSKGAVHVSELLEGLVEEVIERAERPHDVWGIPFGIIELDHWLGGMQLGEVTMLSGDPGIGKSKLASQMARSFANYAPGAVYSLEMQQRQLMRRNISAEGMIPTYSMKSGKMEEHWDAFYKAISDYSELPIYLSDNPEMTTAELRADLWHLQSTAGVKWAVIDYMHLLTDGDGKLNETEQSALISRRLKAVARSLNIALLVINSVVKEAMDSKFPSQKDARGSGQVIHDVDNLMFLKKSEHKDMVCLVLVKSREGKVGRLELLARPQVPRFESLYTGEGAEVGGSNAGNWWNK